MLIEKELSFCSVIMDEGIAKVAGFE